MMIIIINITKHLYTQSNDVESYTNKHIKSEGLADMYWTDGHKHLSMISIYLSVLRVRVQEL